MDLREKIEIRIESLKKMKSFLGIFKRFHNNVIFNYVYFYVLFSTFFFFKRN